MGITTEMIKKLRDKTGAGMMDCKRALEASNGDMNAAVEYLRKKGAALAEKRADRSAKEGVIASQIGSDGKRGVLVEVNCETDFVARGEDFTGFAQEVVNAVAREGVTDVSGVPGLKTISGSAVGDLLTELLAKVGEKVEVRRIQALESKDGFVSSYIHVGGKIGVLTEITGGGHADATKEVGRNIAMQVAAMSPMVVSRDQVSRQIIDRELEIYRTQAANEGKPAAIQEKIANGKLEKFYQEVCLLEQTYIKDSGKTVKEFLAESGTGATVTRFARFHLGEE